MGSFSAAIPQMCVTGAPRDIFLPHFIIQSVHYRNISTILKSVISVVYIKTTLDQ